jgi:zinc D-Ala-D-Ala dipeptidase
LTQRRTRIRLRKALLASALACAAVPSGASDLPDGFVRVTEVSPTIREDIRYAGPDNFVGRPLSGYEAGVCILRTEAARALARIQESLAGKGLGLVVYDCYRPKRAVADMLRWAQAPSGPRFGPFHPTTDRRGLVSQGYVAARSLHSTGLAVDLGLARLDAPRAPVRLLGDCTAPVEMRGDQGALDFGTAFDCFDQRSSASARGLSVEAAANRRQLIEAMAEQGFLNYPREWWHFSYGKSRRGLAQDFPVAAR